MFCLFPYTTPTYEVPRRARPTSSETLAPPRARFLDTQHRVSPEALPSPHSPVTKRILHVRLTDGSEVPILGNPSRPLPLPSKQYPFMLLLCDRRHHVFKELWLLKKKKKKKKIKKNCLWFQAAASSCPPALHSSREKKLPGLDTCLKKWEGKM